MWYNPIMVWMLYSSLHGMLSGDMMVLNYIGMKSGKAYRLPVSYKRIDDTLLTSGYKRRTWCCNLSGGVTVSVHPQGEDINGQAEVIIDEQMVMNGIIAFIGGDSRTAVLFGVKLGMDGQPEPERLSKSAREQGIVHTVLK
jgi:hypothetical protein